MEDKIRVLLIEDDQDDALLVRESLDSSEHHRYELVRVDRLMAGLDLLRAEHFDVVLLDLSLPDSQGIDTFIEIFVSRIRIPVIVMTGLHDNVMSSRMFRLGAQGYLVKGVDNTDLLPHIIAYGIEQFRARQEAEENQWTEEFARDCLALCKAWTENSCGEQQLLESSAPDRFQALVELYREEWLHATEPRDTAPDGVPILEMAEELADLLAGPCDALAIFQTAMLAFRDGDDGNASQQDHRRWFMALTTLMGFVIAAYRRRMVKVAE